MKFRRIRKTLILVGVLFIVTSPAWYAVYYQYLATGWCRSLGYDTADVDWSKWVTTCVRTETYRRKFYDLMMEED